MESTPLLRFVAGYEVERAAWVGPSLIVARLRMSGRKWARFYLSLGGTWTLYRSFNSRRDACGHTASSPPSSSSTRAPSGTRTQTATRRSSGGVMTTGPLAAST